MRYGADGAGLPEQIGGYTVERELGAGGMGTVYLARSRGGRAVAVKVARPELASDPHFRERFRAEVAAARSVGGFHTAPVVDADPAAEAPWLATAYVPGPTLAELLDAEGPMGEARLRQLGAALAEALEAIHRCGLVHRDLKPGNIIMASDGPRVLDFGIARALESPRLTATGMAFGTPGFLAPEQAQGQEVGPAADVFALGAVLVAAAGGSAFGAGTPMGMMYRSVHEAPDLTAVPDGLRPVVASCLAKSPDQRPTLGHLLDLIAPATARYSPTVAIPPPPSHAPHIPAPVYQAPAGYGQGYGHAQGYGHGQGNGHGQGYGQGSSGYGSGYGGGVPPADDLAFLAVAPDSALMIDEMGVTIDFRFRSLQFGWDEIRTVQYAPEGPKHLRVVVHLHDGTAHPCLLAARRRSRLKGWLQDLPMILACFT
ncbi:serine/threonine protein kinase [Streptomyces sp. SID11233]|nr:serine/threonine protein kinase [Streptomyces sp. SID11233]